MIARSVSPAFAEILEAARNLDTAALLRLKKQHGTLDIKDHQGIATPAAYFASVCQTKIKDAVIASAALVLLRKLGASDDYIAMGFAAAGNVEEADKLRRQHGVKLKYLAIGAAMCSDVSYAEKLRQMYQLSPLWLVYGATLGKNFDYAETLCAGVDSEDYLYKFVKIARMKAAKQGGELELSAKLSMNESDIGLKVRMNTLFLQDAISVFEAARHTKHEIRNEELFKKTTSIPRGSRLRKLTQHANLEEVVNWVNQSIYFHSNEILTYEFTFIKDETFIDNLCRAAESVSSKAPFIKGFCEDNTGLKFRECAHKAKLLRRLMKQFLFDYDQANAFLELFEYQQLFFLLVYKMKQADVLAGIIRSLTGLSYDATQAMLEKYFLFHAKTHVVSKMNELNAKYTGGLLSFFGQNNSAQKLERVQSVATLSKKCRTFNELNDILLTQHGLFAGYLDLEMDEDAPKCMKPLSNHDKTCELNPLVDALFSSKYLNREYMSRRKP